MDESVNTFAKLDTLDAAGKAGIGLDKVKAHSRHAAIGTWLIYADEHDRQGTQRTLSDLVARQVEPPSSHSDCPHSGVPR